jgi:hypothetical protein
MKTLKNKLSIIPYTSKLIKVLGYLDYLIDDIIILD